MRDAIRERSQATKVSVVTPFHNTASYLQECIESVLAQTHENFEYILLNNASTDGSREIAARYAAMDPRVILLDTPKLLPQVENYNFALTHIAADSEYCKIVQADDWIYAECLERMLQVGLQDSTIGLIAAFYLQGNQVAGWGVPVSVSRYSGRDIGRYHLLGGNFLFGSPSTVMYRADLVRNQHPFYATGRYHEDTDAAYDILKRNNFGFVHQVLSFIRTDNESIMKSASRFNPWILDRYIALRTHGRHFLNEDEYATRLEALESEYVRFLGDAFLRLRPPELWRYHEKGLATIGETLPRTKVWLCAANSAMNWVLNPKSSIERIWAALIRALRPLRIKKDALSALAPPTVPKQRDELR